MIVKKQTTGELVEIKKALHQPDLVLQSAPETDQLLANAATLVAKGLTGLQRLSHGNSWVPDPTFAKQVKELVDVTMTIDKYKQQVIANDALAMLSDEEMAAKLEALHAKKLGGKDG